MGLRSLSLKKIWCLHCFFSQEFPKITCGQKGGHFLEAKKIWLIHDLKTHKRQPKEEKAADYLNTHTHPCRSHVDSQRTLTSWVVLDKLLVKLHSFVTSNDSCKGNWGKKGSLSYYELINRLNWKKSCCHWRRVTSPEHMMRQRACMRMPWMLTWWLSLSVHLLKNVGQQ